MWHAESLTQFCRSPEKLDGRGAADAEDAQLEPAQNTLRELTSVLGLQLKEKTGSNEQDAQVNALIEERNEARKQKQWARSDEIRDQLREMGVTIEDTKDGTIWRYS